jgi:hypothetical protein
LGPVRSADDDDKDDKDAKQEDEWIDQEDEEAKRLYDSVRAGHVGAGTRPRRRRAPRSE